MTGGNFTTWGKIHTKVRLLASHKNWEIGRNLLFKEMALRSLRKLCQGSEIANNNNNSNKLFLKDTFQRDREGTYIYVFSKVNVLIKGEGNVFPIFNRRIIPAEICIKNINLFLSLTISSWLDCYF